MSKDQMNDKQSDNGKYVGESVTAVSSSHDDSSTAALSSELPRKKQRVESSATSADDASYDADFDLSTVSGQAAAHPEWSLQECRAAAKKEYNRRNAARARIRNKNLMSDLQAKVVSMAQREEALVNENALLRAQVAVYKEQLDILGRERGVSNQVSLVGTASLAAQATNETRQAADRKLPSRPLLEAHLLESPSARSISASALEGSDRSVLAALLSRHSGGSEPMSFSQTESSLVSALRQTHPLLASRLQQDQQSALQQSLSSSLGRRHGSAHNSDLAFLTGASALGASQLSIDDIRQQALRELLFRHKDENGNLR